MSDINQINDSGSKKIANAFASVDNFKKYIETGDEKYLNDVNPDKDMKDGTEYYALGEGWEEKRVK